MRHFRNALFFVAIPLSLASAAAGCAGDPVGRTWLGSDLVEAPPDDAAPLDDVASEEWQAAPAGCEGRLTGNLTFRIASAQDGLVAAVDERGQIICVDTVEAVQEELVSQGDEEQADELGDSFLVSVTVWATTSAILSAADPVPQPNCDPSMGAPRDPIPQPNIETR